MKRCVWYHLLIIGLPIATLPRLLFNYKINLFKEEHGDLTSQEKILLTNMKRTVKLFQNITGDASEVEMWDDNSCLTALKELHMKEGLPLAFAFKDRGGRND